MFGFSPTKFLILAAIIAAIIYAPKILRQIDEMRRQGGKPQDGPPQARIDTKECPICGDYVVPSTAEACDRDTCPYG